MTREEAEKYAESMTYRDAINNLMEVSIMGARVIPYSKATFIKINELLDRLEQKPSGDVISRQAAKTELKNCEVVDMYDENDNFIGYYNADTVDSIMRNLPPVTPQPKMGCEGCTYEKTGNNSTYPCSHCSRCYTDKYKVERNGEE